MRVSHVQIGPNDVLLGKVDCLLYFVLHFELACFISFEKFKCIRLLLVSIVSGRGGNTYRHHGNQQFRNLAGQLAERYNKATKAEKSRMSKEMVMHVIHLDPPGRFLKRVREGEWQDVNFIVAREKASVSLLFISIVQHCNYNLQLFSSSSRPVSTVNYFKQCLRDAASMISSAGEKVDAEIQREQQHCVNSSMNVNSHNSTPRQPNYHSTQNQFQHTIATQPEHCYGRDQWRRQDLATVNQNFQGHNTIKTHQNLGHYPRIVTIPHLISSPLDHHQDNNTFNSRADFPSDPVLGKTVPSLENPDIEVVTTEKERKYPSVSRSKSFDECLNHTFEFWEQNFSPSQSQSTSEKLTKSKKSFDDLQMFHSTSHSINSIDSFARSL